MKTMDFELREAIYDLIGKSREMVSAAKQLREQSSRLRRQADAPSEPEDDRMTET